MVTKDETSETIPRNLFSPFFAFRVPGRLKLTYFVLNHLVNHQNSSFKYLYFLSFGSSLQSYYYR